MPNHFLCDLHLVVNLPVVDLEPQSHEIRQDGGGAGLCFDRRSLLTWDGADDWKTVGNRKRSGRGPNRLVEGRQRMHNSIREGLRLRTYGTIWGPNRSLVVETCAHGVRTNLSIPNAPEALLWESLQHVSCKESSVLLRGKMCRIRLAAPAALLINAFDVSVVAALAPRLSSLCGSSPRQAHYQNNWHFLIENPHQINCHLI